MNLEIPESEPNKNTCEAVGCFAKAVTIIEVKVGQKGLISLSLCESRSLGTINRCHQSMILTK